MTVTACFVTRNHAHVLPRALYAVRDLATETVVVDTGSTDDTIAEAERARAKVLRFAWADDFSAACNAALDAATGEWVLWLNPDEVVDPTAVRVFAGLAADDRVFAYGLTIRQELRADRPGYGGEEVQQRLFRRRPAVRYRGRLHPDFVTPLAELAAVEGKVVALAPPNAVIHRLAFLSPVTPDKVRWTVRLLEAELRDRPGQLHYLIELGRDLLRLNDPRGHEVLAEAADQVKAAAGAERPPTPNTGSLLEYLLSVSAEQCRARIGRDEARELADRWFPVNPPVAWAVASERFGAGDYQAAAWLLEKLLEMGRTGIYDRAAAFRPDILGPAAVINLAACHLKLGRPAEARRLLVPLAADPDYRTRAAELYAAAGSGN